MEEALTNVARMAQRIWTSDQRYCAAWDNPGGPQPVEFCSLLNAAIRADDRELLTAVAPLSSNFHNWLGFQLIAIAKGLWGVVTSSYSSLGGVSR